MTWNPRFGAEDAALVERCRRGESRAWNELVGRHQRIVYAIVRRTGSDEHVAADVFQAVFARLLEHLPRLQHPERLQAWIVTTAKREALRLRHLSQRERSTGDPDGAAWLDTLEDEAPLAETALESLQQLALLRTALDRIEPRCRDLLTRLFADPPPAYEDVGRELGLPVGSIGPTRARCLGKLRRLFDET